MGQVEPAGTPASATSAAAADKPEATQQCPQCAALIAADSRFCPSCGAKYEATAKGYCPTCHAVVPADEQGKCRTCGGELVDGRMESNVPVDTGQPVAKARQMTDLKRARIHCRKCKVENLPGLDRCQQCGANLLPAENVGVRLAYVIVSLLAALLCGYLAYRFSQSPETAPQIPICNPFGLALVALSLPFWGIWMALRRTPDYVRYADRAKRHITLNAWQAVADFTQALALAPKKERAGLMSQRAKVYEQLGLRDEATRDLLGRISQPGAFEGEAQVAAGVLGVDQDAYTTSRSKGERQALIDSGRVKAVGYCPRCEAAVELDPKLHCLVHGSQKGKAVQLALPREIEAGKQAVYQELDRQRRSRRRRAIRWVIVLAIASVGCFVLADPWGVLKKEPTPTALPPATAAASAASASASFADNVFSFEYPAGWITITEEEIESLLATSLRGIDDWDYIGGVYTGEVGDCSDCAQIVAVVLNDPGLPGTLTDEQYEQVKAATESQMGSRLLLHRKIQVGSFPAVESVYLGKSGLTKLWDLVIVPPEPGVVYQFSCSADKDSYGDFEPVFARAIESLQIEGSTPVAAPAETPPSQAAEPSAGSALTPGAATCQPGAELVRDVSIPPDTQLQPGELFTKTWQMRSSGCAAWEAGTRLAFVDGAQMNAVESIEISEIPSGQMADLSIAMQAPDKAGSYTGYWQMQQPDGRPLGDKLSVSITVSGSSATKSPTACPANPALVSITNRLNVALRLSLQGPDAYEFRLAAGQTRNLCLSAGTYTYTAVPKGRAAQTGDKMLEAGGPQCWWWLPRNKATPKCNAPSDPEVYRSP